MRSSTTGTDETAPPSARPETTGAGAEANAAAAAELGYNPGWNAATWSGGAAPTLPTPTLPQTVGGALRIAGFVLATLILLPPFFIARALGGRRERAVISLWCGIGARLCGLRIRRHGAPLTSGGALMVNHASWLDILVIGASAPVHFVAKAEVSGWPFFGWIGKISNTVFIARRRAEAKAQEALLSARARNGDLLCLFPEGTSSDGQRVLPFKSALFAMARPAEGPAVTVQPAAVRYHAPPGLPDAFHGWWGRMPLFPHIWSIVCLGRGGVADIHFLDPLRPESGAGRKEMAAAAEAAVRTAHADARR